MYRVIVEFEDNESLSAETAVDSMKPVFGENAIIKAFPVSNSPEAHLEYAISELMVLDIIDAYMELWPHLYEKRAKEIKQAVLDKLSNTIDNVEKKILAKLE